MGREAGTKVNYDVLALVTMNKDRILGGKQLTLLASDEEEQKTMTADIAKALKADVVKMTSGDYLVIRG
ncbi:MULTISPECIES: capping complex subunit for YIEGIA [Bacillaceae]|uniref:capping complex subunit for YIEGIA n=1 Tax=Bacillaceae TaxID=186817 RepID=UPI002FFF0766